MDIAKAKRRENIAEYILYLWQLEDLLRALQFSPEAIFSTLIAPRKDIGEEQKHVFLLWYMDLANLLRQEGKEEKGHLEHTLHLIGYLHDLHLQLMKLPVGEHYRRTYARLEPELPRLRAVLGNPGMNDTELCFRALYAAMLYRIKGEGEKSAEDFWVKSERLFYCALIGYIWYEAPEAEKNFTTLLEMINASEAREDDPEFQSPVDLMFERLEEKDPEHFAVRQYKKFLLSAGKTRSSILISCGARLAPFDIRELRELMETDEMELDTLGDRKTALFVIISDTDDTFNFVVSILYTQLFNLLCDKADDVYGGRLPVHVRCLLDEFANIGQIPKFEKLIATIRSREISASIILQSQSQLKAIYKDNADTIVGNCDTTLFLGGKEKTTLKEMSEILGKETIDSFNTSETRGRELSHGLNYQKLGKQLMSEDEIAVMDGGKCILQLRGVRPFFSDKYDITKHPNYKYLSDYDKKNTFDMEKHLRRRPALVKPDEVFDYYELDAADLE